MHHLLTQTVSPTGACMIAFVIAAAVTDTFRHRIPNTLTVTAAAIGILTNLVATGWPGVVIGAAGLVAGFALFLPFYLARGFSAGDVKAMAAVGAFLGPKGVLLAAAWTLVVGALVAIVLLISGGGAAALKTMLQRWSARAWVLISTGTPVHIAPPATDAAARRFPYGLAIACGSVISMAWS